MAKKTIADLERGARAPQGRTAQALTATLEASGITFIPQNGGGAGARLRIATPRLFRRDDVPQREWIAFAFDYRGRRTIGFVTYDALYEVGVEGWSPIRAFDEARQRILTAAAEKVDRRDFGDGDLFLRAADLPPVALREDG